MLFPLDKIQCGLFGQNSGSTHSFYFCSEHCGQHFALHLLGFAFFPYTTCLRRKVTFSLIHSHTP